MNLTCPYCGSTLDVETEYQGNAYMQENVVIGIMCDNYPCSATWDRYGNSTSTPSDPH